MGPILKALWSWYKLHFHAINAVWVSGAAALLSHYLLRSSAQASFNQEWLVAVCSAMIGVFITLFGFVLTSFSIITSLMPRAEFAVLRQRGNDHQIMDCLASTIVVLLASSAAWIVTIFLVPNAGLVDWSLVLSVVLSSVGFVWTIETVWILTRMMRILASR